MKYPFVFGISLMIGELLLAGLLWFSAPPHARWLGNTLMNSSDAAVYLSYLQQGVDGHILLHSLYAVESNAARFDLVWSTLGVVSRHFSPLIVQEGARLLFTAILVTVLWRIVTAHTSNPRDARHALLLTIGGASGGFLYSIWLGASHAWTPTTYPAIDLGSEFALAPILIGGVHMILSVALLLAALFWSRSLGSREHTREIVFASTAAALLFTFHPYFVPLCGVYLMVTIARRWRNVDRSTLWRHLAILLACLIPAAVVYVPLAFDPVFRTHHLSTNVLPLPPFFAWASALLPAVLAILYRVIRRIRLTDHEQWIVIWIAAVLVCLALPFPFHRKFLEGLNVGLVLLALPAFFSFRDTLLRGPSRLITAFTSIALTLAVWFGPIHLLTTQIAWTRDAEHRRYFYATDDTFAAWRFLHDRAQEDLVATSDDFWINLWIPAYAGRVTWVAHDHETPDFSTKRDAWRILTTTTDAQTARRILREARITDFLTTSAASRVRFASLLGREWHIVFETETTAVFERVPVLPTLARD